MNDLVLRDIAEKLGAEWEKLATFLGFSVEEISNLKTDIPGQTEEQIFSMLVKWRQRQPCSLDQSAGLCKQLRRVRRLDLADELQMRFSSSGRNDPEHHHHQPREEDRSRCQTHKHEVPRFFCETCQMLMCHACTVIDHKSIDYRMAYLKYRRSMNETIPFFNQEINDLKKSFAETTLAKKEFVANYVQTKARVHDEAARKIADVKAEEKQMIGKMVTLRRERDRSFDEYESKVRKMLQRKQSLKTAIEDTKNASHSDFLAIYPKISKDLQSLSCQEPPQINPKLSYLKFKSSRCVGDTCLGTLELLEDSEWKLSRAFGEGSGPGEFNGARGIAARPPDEIVVTDYFNKRVVICNSKGKPMKTIPMKESPFDVAALPDDRLVVVDGTEFVKVFTKDNTLVSEFPTVLLSEVGKTEVDLRSVAVRKDGTIIVGDIKRNVLTEHRSTDGILIRTISLKTKPYFLAIDDGTDRVVISGITKKVCVADSNGATVISIKPIIKGKRVRKCTGVYWDHSGIYIAMNNEDHDTGHIHHYDVRGEFLGCVARGLHLPLGIAFTADGEKLAVADWSGPVKIYQRKV